ncbi:MAG: TlpA disulfide reductase family protein [Bacteroidota bacterium]
MNAPRQRLDTLRAAWESPRGQRWRRIGYWALMAGLIGVVVWRYLPDYRLPDLGPAPEASGVALSGERVDLAAYPGQVVVLNVWATWCPPCVVETPGFVDLATDFEGEVQFVGLAAQDDPEAVRDFGERYDVPYPLVMVGALDGPAPPGRVLPTTYVIDKAGRVRLRHEGLLVEAALRPILKRLTKE